MFAFFQEQFATNPLLTAGVTTAAVGSALVYARSVPAKLVSFVKSQFTTTVTIYSEDTIWRRLDAWLALHPSARHSRRFGVAEWHNREINDDDYALTPGAGFHLIAHKGHHFLVHREIAENTGGQDSFNRRRTQTVTITTLGRSRKALEDILIDIKTIQEDHTTIPVYLWTGHDYSLVERRTKRPMRTVYASAEVKEGVIEDAQKFLSGRQSYVDRGIPYRRGYLLEGPPGTGKTTLIFALASLLDKPIYLINPASIENDNYLQRAINSAGSNIVVLEDIDNLLAAASREEEPSGTTLVSGDANRRGVTLSGLLNAIDGIGSRDGRMLFLTSNYPDTLDSALIRPGRIDCRVHLAHAGPLEAQAMHDVFFPDEDSSEFLAEIESHLPISAAELQNRMLGRLAAAA